MRRSIVCLGAVAILAACSSVPYAQQQTERNTAYDAVAGTPVQGFPLNHSLWSWEPLGDNQVAVYTRADRAWLLDVPGCMNLPFTNVIGLTSSVDEV